MSILTNLISRWHMDNDAWVDSFGSNDGSAIGAIFKSDFVKVGSHCGFGDGINDRVAFLHNTSIPSEGSMSLWIRPTAWGSSVNPFSNNFAIGSNQKAFRLEEAGGRIRIVLANDAGGDVTVLQAAALLSVDTYYHVVVTWDQPNSSREIWLDNVKDSNYITTFSLPTQWWNFTGWGGVISPARDFNGRIDEWGYWDRVLTPTEITHLYNGGDGREIADTFNGFPFFFGGGHY